VKDVSYEINSTTGMCSTDCPNGLLGKVGSALCEECFFCKGWDRINRIVTCGFDKLVWMKRRAKA
jgi:hypothetical protein